MTICLSLFFITDTISLSLRSASIPLTHLLVFLLLIAAAACLHDLYDSLSLAYSALISFPRVAR
jgi:hypothetical protein